MVGGDDGWTTYHALLDPTEEALVARSREVARERLDPLASRVDREGSYSPEALAALREAGLLGTLVPSEYGGSGAGSLAAVLSIEALAAACPSTAALLLFHHTVVRRIAAAGGEEQKRELLPALCEQLGASAWTEPESSADKKTLHTTARRVEGGFRVAGRKSFCTGAGVAELYTVLVAGPDGEAGESGPVFGRDDQSFVLVRRDNPGLRFGEAFDGFGLRGSMSGELILEDAFVPEHDLLGAPGEGPRIMGLQRRSGLHPGILGLGIAARTLEETRRFVGARRTSRFQAVRFAIADMALALEGARLMAYEAARRADLGHPQADRASLLAKVRSAEAARTVTTLALQLWGQTGYSRGSPVERLLRDACATPIMGPTSELCREIVGSGDLGFGGGSGG